MKKQTSTTKETVKPFDISTRRMQESAVVTLLDPEDVSKELNFHVTILSPASAEAQAAEERFPLKIVNGKVEMADKEFEVAMTERLVAVTKAWDLAEDGRMLPCTPEHVRRIYTAKDTRWVKGQVQKKYLSLASFFVRREAK